MSAQFDEAIARFDTAHAEDPERDAVGQPAELVYAQRMSAWLEKLAPGAATIAVAGAQGEVQQDPESKAGRHRAQELE